MSVESSSFLSASVFRTRARLSSEERSAALATALFGPEPYARSRVREPEHGESGEVGVPEARGEDAGGPGILDEIMNGGVGGFFGEGSAAGVSEVRDFPGASGRRRGWSEVAASSPLRSRSKATGLVPATTVRRPLDWRISARVGMRR